MVYDDGAVSQMCLREYEIDTHTHTLFKVDRGDLRAPQKARRSTTRIDSMKPNAKPLKTHSRVRMRRRRMIKTNSLHGLST
jgi:hypothetical protein